MARPDRALVGDNRDVRVRVFQTCNLVKLGRVELRRCDQIAKSIADTRAAVRPVGHHINTHPVGGDLKMARLRSAWPEPFRTVEPRQTGFVDLVQDRQQRTHLAEIRSDHPTLPSSEIEISFCASTANSIGSCCSTSFTKPLTTRPTASSWLSPRWMQ